MKFYWQGPGVPDQIVPSSALWHRDTIARTEPPTVSPDGGPFVGNVSVSLASLTPGALIYYTDDGSTPTEVSLLYTGAFNVTNSRTIRARSYANGFDDSYITSAYFTDGTNDTTKPVLDSARADETDTQITVIFSEPVDPATAGNKANYSLSGGITVVDAQVANVSADAAYLAVETSPDGLNWTEGYRTNITELTYVHHRYQTYEPTNRYVRVLNVTTGVTPARLCLDNVLITGPLASDLTPTNFATWPTVPLFTDDVYPEITLTRFFMQPSNITVTCYYHVGTADWGDWAETDALGMALVSSNLSARPATYTFRATNAIPAMAIDTCVQYTFRAWFDGLFSHVASPKLLKNRFMNPSWYWPADYNVQHGPPRTPYYVVFSCPPGAVWINEVNLDDLTYGDKEYVELLGPAGTIIHNWKIKTVTFTSQYKTNDFYEYPIVTNSTLDNDDNGFGFWTLADVTLPYDQTFTNTPYDGAGSWDYHMPTPEGGVILVRSMGAYEYALSYMIDGAPGYADNIADFTYIGMDAWARNSPLGLIGTGSNYADFAWSLDLGQSSWTPGTANGSGQTLVPQDAPILAPAAELQDMWMVGNTLYVTCVSTNGWTPTPYYSGDLRTQPTPTWTELPAFSDSYSAGTSTIWFDFPTNRHGFVRVILQEP